MGQVILHIPVNGSFSFEECLWFLDRNFDDCMHEVGAGYVRKALLIRGKPILLEVSANKERLDARILKGEWDTANEAFLRGYITEWFDLDLDISPFYKLLEGHPCLSYMHESYGGLRVVGIPDLFEVLGWSIIGQQINLPFAYRLKRRLAEKYGSHVEYEGRRYVLFPSPQALSRADPGDLREMQFSVKKAEYLIGLAGEFEQGRISKQLLAALPDCTSRRKALTDIRGIGIWSANYALMKSLKEPACIPYGDTGLLKALLQHKIIKDKRDGKAVDRFFKKFSGWESYLVFYLWRSLSSPAPAILIFAFCLGFKAGIPWAIVYYN